MLDAPELVLGVSTRWPGHKRFVKRTSAKLKRQVDKAGFMAQAFMGKLVSRVNAALRSWNGRVFVGIGPNQHVLFGLGTDDRDKTERAVLGSIALARDNLSLLRMVANNVPSLSLRKADGVNVLTIGGIRKMVGKELAPLLTAKGQLKIAFIFSKRRGALQGVIGPTAGAVLRAWRKHNSTAQTGAASKGDYIAAAFATTPAQLAPLLDGRARQELASVFALTATGKPMKVVVVREADAYRVRVTGPR
jgi:hypothetical protein